MLGGGFNGFYHRFTQVRRKDCHHGGSSPYHPQSDGQTKIVNKCLEGYLRFFVFDKKTQWVKWLPLVEWWYNTSFHTTAKMTHFMALYGFHPPSIT